MELSIDAILAVAEGNYAKCLDSPDAVSLLDLNRALIALGSIKAIDDFVYRLKMRSGSQLGLPKAPVKRKSPLRRHLEAEENIPRQLLLPNTAGPIPAKKRKKVA